MTTILDDMIDTLFGFFYEDGEMIEHDWWWLGEVGMWFFERCDNI